MENIFHDVEDAEVYIDYIGAFSRSWDDHMALLHTILTKLQEHGFTVKTTYMWLSSQKDWLVRLLAYHHRTETLEKENWCSTNIESST